MLAPHDNRHPGDAEAAAAIAALTETHGGYQPAIGDRVRCERPFYADFAIGTVVAVKGVYVLVELPTEAGPEHLAYYPHELTQAN